MTLFILNCTLYINILFFLLMSDGLFSVQNCLETKAEVIEMKTAVEDAVEKVLAELIAHRDTLNQYSHLWVEDRQEYMRLFLKYNHRPTQEELSLAGDEGIPECPPTLPQFKEMVRANGVQVLPVW